MVPTTLVKPALQILIQNLVPRKLEAQRRENKNRSSHYTIIAHSRSPKVWGLNDVKTQPQNRGFSKNTHLERLFSSLFGCFPLVRDLQNGPRISILEAVLADLRREARLAKEGGLAQALRAQKSHSWAGRT